MLGSIQLVGQIIAAVLLILAPTLFFLALWHGLHYIRNERLIGHLYGDVDGPVRPPQFDFSVLLSLNDTNGDAVSDNACAYCGRRCSGTICSLCDERY